MSVCLFYAGDCAIRRGRESPDSMAAGNSIGALVEWYGTVGFRCMFWLSSVLWGRILFVIFSRVFIFMSCLVYVSVSRLKVFEIYFLNLVYPLGIGIEHLRLSVSIGVISYSLSVKCRIGAVSSRGISAHHGVNYLESLSYNQSSV